MKVLIADDDLISRRVLEATLSQWAYEVAVARDGREAWNILGGADAPPLAILDWAMPEADGPELCRRARANGQAQPTYLILLIPRREAGDIVAAFAAGADDFLVKPFDRGELQARLQVGRRIVELQRGLADRVRELEAALARVQQLQGLLPICAWCKRIRDDQNYWHQVETYLAKHSEVRFSHGICPDCEQNMLFGSPLLAPAGGRQGDGTNTQVG
ncbi:MAG TPA: response regulator [Gemmataceae bacterium]|nr:response regulator [Gemmataceae bacterium]